MSGTVRRADELGYGMPPQWLRRGADVRRRSRRRSGSQRQERWRQRARNDEGRAPRRHARPRSDAKEGHWRRDGHWQPNRLPRRRESAAVDTKPKVQHSLDLGVARRNGAPEGAVGHVMWKRPSSRAPRAPQAERICACARRCVTPRRGPAADADGRRDCTAPELPRVWRDTEAARQQGPHDEGVERAVLEKRLADGAGWRMGRALAGAVCDRRNVGTTSRAGSRTSVFDAWRGRPCIAPRSFAAGEEGGLANRGICQPPQLPAAWGEPFLLVGAGGRVVYLERVGRE